MIQRTLFEPREHPEEPKVKLPSEPTDTQEEAAARALPRSGTARARVLAAIRAAGRIGSTDEELQLYLEMNPNTQRPRRKELAEMGWIDDSGERRKTKSGSRAIVWKYRENP